MTQKHSAEILISVWGWCALPVLWYDTRCIMPFLHRENTAWDTRSASDTTHCVSSLNRGAGFLPLSVSTGPLSCVDEAGPQEALKSSLGDILVGGFFTALYCQASLPDGLLLNNLACPFCHSLLFHAPEAPTSQRTTSNNQAEDPNLLRGCIDFTLGHTHTHTPK